MWDISARFVDAPAELAADALGRLPTLAAEAEAAPSAALRVSCDLMKCFILHVMVACFRRMRKDCFRSGAVRTFSSASGESEE